MISVCNAVLYLLYIERFIDETKSNCFRLIFIFFNTTFGVERKF